MVRLTWTDQAVSDLKEIAEYISKDSKNYARLQIQRLRARTQILKSNPFSGQTVGFFEDESIRQLTEGNYIIVYKILDTDRIDILSVHYTARDMGKRKLIH